MKTILIFCAALVVVRGIYDGNDATKHQFPYLVYTSNSRFYCAGTLISDRHVLTAAHCLMSLRQGEKARIILGMHYNGWTKDGLTVWSSNYSMHEKFSMPLAEYDIGVIELPASIHNLVNNSRLAKSIKIETGKNIDLDPSQKNVIVAGWGHTSRFNPARTPKYTRMSLISINECLPYKSHYIESITLDHICAESTHGIPCDGDSGSALISTKTNKLIGVLSYVKDAENFTDIGYNDCKTKVPVVATRVSSYIDWISSKTGIDFSKPDKICRGVGAIKAENIQNYEGCEIIEGNLEINNETFAGMSPENLKIFKSVRKITGILKIFASHPDFTDLSCFENLESLNENGYESKAALDIFKTSLKSLRLISLHRVHNGAIVIELNENLCYVENFQWNKIIPNNEVFISIKNNRNAAECGRFHFFIGIS